MKTFLSMGNLWQKILKFIPSKRIVIFFLLILFAGYGAWKVFGIWLFVGIAGYMAYYAVTHIKQLRLTEWQDWVDPRRWASVLFASFMKMMFPLHIVEQLILRMYDMECRGCVKNGSCVHCGCDISKVYTPWDICTRGNWREMIENAKRYRKFREEWPIEISIKYTKEL